MDQNKKARHKMLSWASVIRSCRKKRMVCESPRRILGGKGGIFLGVSNVTGCVDFESHLPEW